MRLQSNPGGGAQLEFVRPLFGRRLVASPLLAAAMICGCGNRDDGSAPEAQATNIVTVNDGGANDGAVNSSVDGKQSQIPSAESGSALDGLKPPVAAHREDIIQSDAGGVAAAYQLQPAHRLKDDRTSPDPARLTASGIRMQSSKHLVLLSDVDDLSGSYLTEAADALFATLQRSVGPVANAADGSEFQVTGCLIEAGERFEQAGVMPDPDFTIRHGRHLGYRFWMFNPSTDYYRRHLLLHEFVHCYMMCEHGMQNIPPLWFTEGMAEYWATHTMEHSAASGEPASQGSSEAVFGRNENSVQFQFGVLPASTDAFPGWGRISEIRRSFQLEPICAEDFGSVRGTFAKGSTADFGTEQRRSDHWIAGQPALDSILNPPTSKFADDSQYAYAWALCWFLHNHPDYRQPFTEVQKMRRGDLFRAAFDQNLSALLPAMGIDWLLTVDSLTEGFDPARCFSRRVGHPPLPFPAESSAAENATPLPKSLSIAAESDWQSTGLLLTKGQQLQISASGRFQIGKDSEAWIAEPNGVTLQFYRGRPLGELVAILVDPQARFASRRIAIGSLGTFEVPFDGELWLQLNDSAAQRYDNQGSANVVISVIP